jgi:ribosome-binding factor A
LLFAKEKRYFMAGYKLDRINADIQRELSDIIRNLKDPRITGLVSIIKVDVSQDLSYAKVYVSEVGGDADEAIKGLKNAAGYARRELSSRLTIRKTPELKFIQDDSIEHSAKISKILNEIIKDEKE